MPFELSIALRYLVARRRQAFISLISSVSALGVTVGVTALIIALALMTGLQGELRDRMLGSMPHIFVAKIAEGGVADPDAEIAKLLAVPHVAGASPVVLGPALVRAGERTSFVTLRGVDPARESSVTEIGRRMQQGSLDALAPRREGPDGIALGSELARTLGVGVGDGLTIGLRLMGKSHPDFVQLRVDDVYRAPEVTDAIVERFGASYNVQDWAQMNQSLFSALWLEKMAISITIGLIVMVAALNIVASLVLMVMEKSRDIAILKTMGASSRSITLVFMAQGVLIGAAGTLAGSVLGLGLSYLLDRYKLVQIPTEVYQIAYVPFRVEPFDLAVVVVSALVICFLATIYPSRQAAKLDPAEALRYG
jgi:lipoprotein-releasing system permease protein